MKLFLITISLILFNCCLVQAQAPDSLQVEKQDTLWDAGGDINVNFSQVSLSNWAGGGQSSISLGNIVNLHANYDDNKNLWNNKFQGTYGLIRQGKGKQQPIRKSDDSFIIESQYGRNFSENWMASALVNLRSQFYKGEEVKVLPDGRDSTYLVSEIFSPAYLQVALGVAFKKNNVFNFTLSPLTSKNTVVLNESLATNYGLAEGEKIRSEVGASYNANFKKEILKNVKLESNLNLFSNYETFEKVDVNWSVHFVLKVNKFITSSITTHLIYDDDIDVPRDNKDTPGPAIQFKSAINVGFAYSF